jgi:hypothetical protein
VRRGTDNKRVLGRIEAARRAHPRENDEERHTKTVWIRKRGTSRHGKSVGRSRSRPKGRGRGYTNATTSVCTGRWSICVREKCIESGGDVHMLHIGSAALVGRAGLRNTAATVIRMHPKHPSKARRNMVRELSEVWLRHRRELLQETEGNLRERGWDGACCAGVVHQDVDGEALSRELDDVHGRAGLLGLRHNTEVVALRQLRLRDCWG